MKITVRFLGVHRSIIGKESVFLEVGEGKKIIDLIKEISEQLEKPEFKKILIDSELEDPRPNNLILVNGREINSLDGLETPLQDGDEVTLVPLVHGG